MIAQQLSGKFEIQKEIGKGQTGTVYYGYDLELRQEVAIKMYHSHINGRAIRANIFNEKAQSLLRLEHPNLIKIIKIEEENTTPVVCMEFFDAPNLQQVIQKEGPLPLEKMLLLAREITEVLVHTHFQGIIHGALHPGHVLVNSQGQVKILDFGLSWILMNILSSQNMHLLRPLPYLLPEMAKGELLDLSSDLYSLGFMMYHMLTARVPYAGLPKTSIMGKLAFDQADPDFDFPDSVPEAVCNLIRQVTRNQSQHRLHDATHVLTVLNQQLAKLAPKEVPASNLLSTPSENRLAQENPEADTGPLIPVSPLPTPPPTPAPALTSESPVAYQPKHSIANQDIPHTNGRKRLGISVGILFVLAGMIIGYWYNNSAVSSLSPELETSSRGLETSFPGPETSTQLSPPVVREKELSAPPTDGFAIQPTPISDPPLSNKSMTEHANNDPDHLLHGKPSIPAPQVTTSAKTSGTKLDEVKQAVTPSLRSNNTTSGTSPISVQQPDPGTAPVPAQSETLRPLDDSRINNSPPADTIMAPGTQPAVTSETSPLSGTGREEPAILENQADPYPNLASEPPSDPPAQTSHDLLKSAPASQSKDSMNEFETGRKLPADQSKPLPPPSEPSAPSLSGSSGSF